MVSKKSNKKVRTDVRLVELGLASSRSRAQALVLAGEVFMGDLRIDKPGTAVAADASLTVRQPPRFVSRGGIKLEGALETLGIDVRGLTCVDVGASTGGFTDCLLQRGAKKVYAADVGQGLLAHKLTTDERVTVLDKTNARYLSSNHFSDAIDFVVVDVSFIGIGKLTDALANLLPPGGHLLAMLKPQFEAGKTEAQKAKGVITDVEVRQHALQAAQAKLTAAGFEIVAGCDSTLPGPKGNIEYFCHAVRR